MSDTSYPIFQHYGTNAERLAFTPSPPATGQPIYIWYETDTGDIYVYHTSWTQITSNSGYTIQPQGRLTITTGVPYPTSDVNNATTVYYTPARGSRVPIYDGSVWNITNFAELSQATTDNTKSPAAVANNSNYDVFVWNDAGTIRATRGPAWSSATSRGTGAGTTELELVNGIYVNKVNITNGPNAQRGTYVGTIRSDGGAAIDDSITRRMVYNEYNQVLTNLLRSDTTSHTYATNTVRYWNNDSTQILEFVIGILHSQVAIGYYRASLQPGVDNRTAQAGTGIDNGTAFVGIALGSAVAQVTDYGNAYPYNSGNIGLGYHFVSSVENAASGASVTLNNYSMALSIMM